MIHTARVMAIAHTAAFVWLTYCGTTCADNHALGYATVFFTGALVAGIAAWREHDRADADRIEAVQAETFARALALQDEAATEDAVTLALDEACCERWWTAIGTDHDPACPNQRRRRAA